MPDFMHFWASPSFAVCKSILNIVLPHSDSKPGCKCEPTRSRSSSGPMSVRQQEPNARSSLWFNKMCNVLNLRTYRCWWLVSTTRQSGKKCGHIVVMLKPSKTSDIFQLPGSALEELRRSTGIKTRYVKPGVVESHWHSNLR